MFDMTFIVCNQNIFIDYQTSFKMETFIGSKSHHDVQFSINDADNYLNVCFALPFWMDVLHLKKN